MSEPDITNALDILSDTPKLRAAVDAAYARVQSGFWKPERAALIALLDYLDLPHTNDLWAAVRQLAAEEAA